VLFVPPNVYAGVEERIKLVGTVLEPRTEERIRSRTVRQREFGNTFEEEGVSEVGEEDASPVIVGLVEEAVLDRGFDIFREAIIRE